MVFAEAGQNHIFILFDRIYNQFCSTLLNNILNPFLNLLNNFSYIKKRPLNGFLLVHKYKLYIQSIRGLTPRSDVLFFFSVCTRLFEQFMENIIWHFFSSEDCKMNFKVLILVVGLLSQVSAGPIGTGICYAGIFRTDKMKFFEFFQNDRNVILIEWISIT